MQYIETITGVEPITVDEVKAYLKISYSQEDTLIASQISEVRSIAEKITSRSLIEKTVQLFDDGEDLCSPYALPMPPHNEVVSFTVNGEDVTYSIIGLTQKKIDYNRVFTNLYSQANYIEAEFTTLAAMNEGLKAAMLRIISDLYEYRGNKFEESINMGLVDGYKLLQPYILVV